MGSRFSRKSSIEFVQQENENKFSKIRIFYRTWQLCFRNLTRPSLSSVGKLFYFAFSAAKLSFESADMEDEKFDLKFVAERFSSSLSKDGEDVLMDFYLEAFREILKFVYLF